ncbi:hypothetical protein [Paenibacillus sp. 1P07SE]|uniref:hypothetical protein n=1 Tax=Paenibacillus sp. 1P07SE TaxID=3132209 RepID=UPI0039A49A6D
MSRCKRKARAVQANKQARVVQANKQVNIVQVNCPGKKSSRRKKRIRYRPRPAGYYLAAGRIFQRCGEGIRTYYHAPNGPCDTIVRIDNDTRCTMHIRLEQQNGRFITGEAEQGQQVSFAVPALLKLTIECRGGGGICKGFYRIQLLQ